MDNIKKLINETEKAFRRNLLTPVDFEALSDNVLMRLNIYLSKTTLMRLWGYIDDGVSPSKTTLNILSRYLGYDGWVDFVARHGGVADTEDDMPSNPVLSRRLRVADELVVGDRLRLVWHPERVCDLEYLGDMRFLVIGSVNTRLREGDTFEMNMVIEGEPLYIDNLCQANNPPIAYVCGKISGVMFERL